MVLEPERGKLFCQLFRVQDSTVPATFKQQRQQCWSCTVCGPGTSFHTLLVVYLEKEVIGGVAALGMKPPLLWHCKPIIMTTREGF